MEAAKKAKKTRLEKYGDENYRDVEKFKKTLRNRTEEQNKQTQDKRVRTCLEKYGVAYACITDYAKSKAHTVEVENKRTESVKKSMLDLYGGYTMGSPVLSEKARKTKLERYGDENWSNREKYKQTMKELTGYENAFQLPEVRERIDYSKVIETKRRKGTLNSSRLEKVLGKVLKSLYPDLLEQYRDERYSDPVTKREYACDFYIPSIDLFIEYQGSQFHHAHPFNANSKEDLEELARLQANSKKCHEEKGMLKCQADVIIDVWTKSDPMKRKVAADNKIKLLEIWIEEKEMTVEKITEIFNNFLKEISTND